MRNPLILLMLSFMAVFAAPKPANADALWQLPLANPKLINVYLQPNSDYSAGHRGVDYLVKQGESVFAPSDGVVRFTGKVVNRGVLSLTHGQSLTTSFEPVCTKLTAGQKVFKGETVATVCNRAGYRNHCGVRICLHFSLRNRDGYLSPLTVIGGLAPSRLLPIKP